MQIKALFLGALAASGVVADKMRCGFVDPTDEDLAIAQHLAEKEAMSRISGNGTMSIQATTIKVYFHVVASSQSASGGYLTESDLSKQLDAMNERYAPYGFTFTRAGADWTVNAGWARDQSETTMKRQLRKGTYADLNVYFLPDMGSTLGYAYLPRSVSSGSSDFYIDGMTIASGTVPGGNLNRFNLGLTAVHEAGHWLGLYHTFNGGCNGAGDYIDDTPAQASASSGCPVGRNSCPSQPGLDPIHNYMDYSDDACYEEFTPGQVTRMNSYWSNYRAGK